MSAHPTKFRADWEPQLLDEQVLAEGEWLHQGQVPYTARLILRHWDYTAADIPEIEAAVTGINADYLDYNIGPEGHTYQWTFEASGYSTASATAPSLEAAMEKLSSFAGSANLSWRRQPG
jgi:hypothetical protein